LETYTQEVRLSVPWKRSKTPPVLLLPVREIRQSTYESTNLASSASSWFLDNLTARRTLKELHLCSYRPVILASSKHGILQSFLRERKKKFKTEIMEGGLPKARSRILQ